MNNLSNSDKEKIMDCAQELQSHMFKGMEANDSFKQLRDKYSDRIIQLSMELLKQARDHEDSPFSNLTKIINRCMEKMDIDWVDKKMATVKGFYEVCDNAYRKQFMTDEGGRGMPIVFLWVKDNPKIGVVPILQDPNENKSPLDYLKEIVYQEQPDAYCMCAEASMLKGGKDDKEKFKEYEYGDITADPASIDVVMLQGNNKRGDSPYIATYKIHELPKGIKLEKMDIDMKEVESDKLP